jgi:hypothetical protein
MAPPVVAQPVPAPAVQAAPNNTLAAPPPVDSDSIAKARDALRKKMAELETQPPAEAPAVAATPVTEAPAKKTKTLKGTPAFPPLQGPAPAVSAGKQERLAELLRKYRADQVTPEEYHVQRAKILAEP